jgi:hypothetical protein
MSASGRLLPDAMQQGERQLLSWKQTNYLLEYRADIRQKPAEAVRKPHNNLTPEVALKHNVRLY